MARAEALGRICLMTPASQAWLAAAEGANAALAASAVKSLRVKLAI